MAAVLLIWRASARVRLFDPGGGSAYLAGLSQGKAFRPWLRLCLFGGPQPGLGCSTLAAVLLIWRASARVRLFDPGCGSAYLAGLSQGEAFRPWLRLCLIGGPQPGLGCSTLAAVLLIWWASARVRLFDLACSSAYLAGLSQGEAFRPWLQLCLFGGPQPGLGCSTLAAALLISGKLRTPWKTQMIIGDVYQFFIYLSYFPLPGQNLAIHILIRLGSEWLCWRRE